MHNTMRTSEHAPASRICVDSGMTIVAASRRMRSFQVEELVVTDRAEATLIPVGTVSARDIVTRIIAVGLDPAVLTAGDIAWADTAGDVNAGSDSLRSLLTSGGRILPVLDCDGGLTGVVSIQELLSACHKA